MMHTFRKGIFICFLLIFQFFCSAQEASNEAGLFEKRLASLQSKGIEITFIQEGEGILPVPGDILEFFMKGNLNGGEVFYSNYYHKEGIKTAVGIGRMVPGLDQAFLLMKAGSKALIEVPANLAYGKEGLSDLVPRNTDVVFEIEVLNHFPASISVLNFQTQGKDTLDGNNGLRYIAVHQTFFPKPYKGDHVWVHYTGRLPDGTIFEANLPNEKAFSFKLGESTIIPGWNQALLLMSTGDKFRFLIPWKLAYGKKGYPGKISPRTNLIFDIELVRFESTGK